LCWNLLKSFSDPGFPPELLQLDNVIVTPHSAALTDEAMRRVGCDAGDDILRVLKGEAPRACANPQVLAMAQR
jgi:D-3-phosphoglycerate dehydrogenase